MTRLERLKELQNTVSEYVSAEKKRINNEVSALKDILDKRNSGKSIQKVSTNLITSVAANDLKTFLTE